MGGIDKGKLARSVSAPHPKRKKGGQNKNIRNGIFMPPSATIRTSEEQDEARTARSLLTSN